MPAGGLGVVSTKNHDRCLFVCYKNEDDTVTILNFFGVAIPQTLGKLLGSDPDKLTTRSRLDENPLMLWKPLKEFIPGSCKGCSCMPTSKTQLC